MNVHWALLWKDSKNSLEPREHLIYENCLPVLFRTRLDARKYADKRYGYIKVREDLRCYPYGWRMPKPIRVTVKAAQDG